MSPTDIPDTRPLLLPPVASHLDRLAEQLERDEPVSHPGAAEALASWIAQHLPTRQHGSLPVIVVCTGNSRRSILGSTMGNLAAGYTGLPGLRFWSGGTTPSAFNPRTIAALRAIGVQVDPTGDEAPPGLDGSPNPVYRIRWGLPDATNHPSDTNTNTNAHTDAVRALGMEAIEFSKPFDHGINPHSGFAALMVCNEADDACPVVPGASIRLSVPIDDPSTADGCEDEADRYASRRDELGRWMLRVLLDARKRLGT